MVLLGVVAAVAALLVGACGSSKSESSSAEALDLVSLSGCIIEVKFEGVGEGRADPRVAPCDEGLYARALLIIRCEEQDLFENGIVDGRPVGESCDQLTDEEIERFVDLAPPEPDPEVDIVDTDEDLPPSPDPPVDIVDTTDPPIEPIPPPAPVDEPDARTCQDWNAAEASERLAVAETVRPPGRMSDAEIVRAYTFMCAGERVTLTLADAAQVSPTCEEWTAVEQPVREAYAGFLPVSTEVAVSDVALALTFVCIGAGGTLTLDGAAASAGQRTCADWNSAEPRAQEAYLAVLVASASDETNANRTVGQVRLACSSEGNPSRVTIEDVISADAPELPITKVKGPALERGMESRRVMTLQEALFYLGYFEARAVDGQLGQTTKRAVQEFQLEMGLNGTGIANEKTIRAINNAVKRAP